MKIIDTPLPGGGLGWSMIDDREIEAVANVLKTPGRLFRYPGEGWKSQCQQFEQEVSEKTGMKYALMVASGTCALTLCLSAYGIGPGDEVIIPAYTYISTASAVTNAGAVPVIADIDDSLGLDPADVERKITKYTKAVILVHMQGVPGRIDAVRAVCKKHGVRMIDDACQAIGSQYRGEYVGKHTDAAAWSLNFYKVITCGEGGVFLTNDDDAYIRAIYAHDPGTPMWKTGLARDALLAPYTQMGMRGNEVCAAIARVQLDKMDAILGRTRELKKYLLSCLDAPKNYARQHVDDPEGDCGISFTMIGRDKEATERMADLMDEQGLDIGSLYNEGFPDRHIYTYWEAILQKRAPTAAGYPWNDPNYQGGVEYSEDMCKNTLDVLARSMRFSINVNLKKEHIEKVAKAINYADSNV